MDYWSDESDLILLPIEICKRDLLQERILEFDSNSETTSLREHDSGGLSSSLKPQDLAGTEISKSSHHHRPCENLLGKKKLYSEYENCPKSEETPSGHDAVTFAAENPDNSCYKFSTKCHSTPKRKKIDSDHNSTSGVEKNEIDPRKKQTKTYTIYQKDIPTNSTESTSCESNEITMDYVPKMTKKSTLKVSCGKNRRIMDSSSSAEELSTSDMEKSFQERMKKKRSARKRFTLARRRNYIYAPIIFADDHTPDDESAKSGKRQKISGDECQGMKERIPGSKRIKSSNNNSSDPDEDMNKTYKSSSKHCEKNSVASSSQQRGTIARHTESTHDKNCGKKISKNSRKSALFNVPGYHVEHGGKRNSCNDTASKQSDCKMADMENPGPTKKQADVIESLNVPSPQKLGSNSDALFDTRFAVPTSPRLLDHIPCDVRHPGHPSSGSDLEARSSTGKPAVNCKDVSGNITTGNQMISAVNDIFFGDEDVIIKPPPSKRKVEIEKPIFFPKPKPVHDVTLLDDDSLWTSRH